MNLSDFASPAENKAANTKPAWIDAESYWIHIISDPSAQTSVSRPLLGKQGNMSETFDIYTLLFLVLAVVIFLRLRNVLGRRTGSERPPYDPYSARDAQHNGNKSSSRDKVVPLPRAGKANQPSDSGRNLEGFEERIKDVAPAGSPLSENLLTIAKTDPTFDPLQFIKGAKTAYEMIVMAFAEAISGPLNHCSTVMFMTGSVLSSATGKQRAKSLIPVLSVSTRHRSSMPS